MSKTRFKLNRAGVKELLKSKEMEGILLEYGNVIVAKCGGDGYETSSFTGKNRSNVSVRASTRKSIKDNLENNTLLKAVH